MGLCLEVVVRWRRRRRRRVAARWEKKRVIRSDSDEAGSSLGASQLKENPPRLRTQNPIGDHRSARAEAGNQRAVHGGWRARPPVAF